MLNQSIKLVRLAREADQGQKERANGKDPRSTKGKTTDCEQKRQGEVSATHPGCRMIRDANTPDTVLRYAETTAIRT